MSDFGAYSYEGSDSVHPAKSGDIYEAVFVKR
jgi:hypothetical protein